MSVSNMDDLNSFYTAHPGLVPPADGRHDAHIPPMMHQGADSHAHLQMPLGDNVLNATELLGQHGLVPEHLSGPQLESALHERLAHMREQGQDPAVLQNLEAVLHRTAEQHRGDSSLEYPHSSDSYRQDTRHVPHTPGREPMMGAAPPIKSGEQLQNLNVMPYGQFSQQKAFGPLDTSAITPASVFSTISSASTNDFLSPITSPALQPQGTQPMFSTSDSDQMALQQAMLSTMSSPSHPNVRVPFPGHAPNAYNRGMFLQGEPSSLPNDASAPASERANVSASRRNRSTTAEGKANKVRSSPFMKPSQSPKVAPGPVGSMAVWQANNGSVANLRKRDANNPHTSPSLGALESLSNTMQEASGLSMPSPAVSPALVAIGHQASGATTPRSMPASHGVPVNRRSKSRLAGDGNDSGSLPETASSTRRNSLNETHEGENTPSPIDLAGHEGHAQRPTKPVTPSTIMGIVPSASPQQQHAGEWTQPPASAPRDAGPEAKAGALSNAPSDGMPSNSFSSFGYGGNVAGLNSFPAQSAVNAVAASALINASQPRPSMFFQGSQPKPILPGGLSSEDRSAWLNLRRVGNGGLDQRRTSHKAAEQKRRDSLKHCFDELRGLLPAITLDESIPCGSVLGPDGSKEDQIAEGFDPEMMRRAKEGDDTLPDGARAPLYVATPEQARDANRAIAKVLLLRHSNEYLVRLKQRIERRDTALQALSQEVVRLRTAVAEMRGESKDPSSVSDNFDSLTLTGSQVQGGAEPSASTARAEGPATSAADTPQAAQKMEVA